MTAKEVGYLEIHAAKVAKIQKEHARLLKRERAFFDEVVAACRAISPDLVEVLLYGSRAEAHAKPTSDWDVLIIVPAQTSHDEFYRLITTASGYKSISGRKVHIQFERHECQDTWHLGNIEFALKIG